MGVDHVARRAASQPVECRANGGLRPHESVVHQQHSVGSYRGGNDVPGAHEHVHTPAHVDGGDAVGELRARRGGETAEGYEPHQGQSSDRFLLGPVVVKEVYSPEVG